MTYLMPPMPDLNAGDDGCRLPAPRLELKNRAQIVRDITERWFSENGICPDCGGGVCLVNRASLDFVCLDSCCGATIELKAKQLTRLRLRGRVQGAAYTSTSRAFGGSRPPHLALLDYEMGPGGLPSRVAHLCFVPGNLLHPGLLRRRAPAQPKARKGVFLGCTIDTARLPRMAFVPWVTHGRKRNLVLFRDEWAARRAIARVRDLSAWHFEVLHCIDAICRDGGVRFELGDLQPFIPELKRRHPFNRFVEAKIRQVLQELRDGGVIAFDPDIRGVYRRLV